jgi:3-dehydroquinate dehydratase-2
MRILIINGPNLNLLGKREPDIYGSVSFEDFFAALQKSYSSIELNYFQSNHEGAIIDKIQEAGFTIDGIILNAAGYTHTSVSIADAVKAIKSPVIEVHISDIYQREKFRHHSFLKTVCIASIVGMGLEGYAKAIEILVSRHKGQAEN